MTEIKDRLVSKAQQSSCRYKVSAIGLDEKGNVIGYAVNTPHIDRKGGSIHAEQVLMNQYGKALHTIIICRTNKTGSSLLPIHPCDTCANRAKRLGIRIATITEVCNEATN